MVWYGMVWYGMYVYIYMYTYVYIHLLLTRSCDCPAGLLTVATWNVEWLFDGIDDPPPTPALDAAAVSSKVKAVADVLDKLDADIIHLAEVENCMILESVGRRLNRSYQPFMIAGTDTYLRQQVALLSQIGPKSIRRSRERADLPGGKSTGISKHLVADFAVGGRDLQILGLHLKARPHQLDARLQREGQARIAQRIIGKALQLGKDVIVLGDLNDFDSDAPGPGGEKPSSSVLGMLKDVDNDGKPDLWNALESVPQAERYSAWHDKNRDGKFQFADERSLIDHILVSESLRGGVEAVGVLHHHNPERTSDHWPVWLRINLEALSRRNLSTLQGNDPPQRQLPQGHLLVVATVVLVALLARPIARWLWKRCGWLLNCSSSWWNPVFPGLDVEPSQLGTCNPFSPKNSSQKTCRPKTGCRPPVCFVVSSLRNGRRAVRSWRAGVWEGTVASSRCLLLFPSLVPARLAVSNCQKVAPTTSPHVIYCI